VTEVQFTATALEVVAAASFINATIVGLNLLYRLAVGHALLLVVTGNSTRNTPLYWRTAFTVGGRVELVGKGVGESALGANTGGKVMMLEGGRTGRNVGGLVTNMEGGNVGRGVGDLDGRSVVGRNVGRRVA
jgi:hypothetical protein